MPFGQMLLRQTTFRPVALSVLQRRNYPNSLFFAPVQIIGKGRP